jgi:Uma2 family endonuclease
MVESTSRLQEEPAPYRFTVKEWHRLGEVGVLDEEARLELLDGEIIALSPIGNRHAIATGILNEFFVENSRRRYFVSPGNPVEADQFSEPVPDLMLVPRSQKTAKRHPLTQEAFLVIEISDSSLAHDRGRKLRKYAKSGVSEYWIVNLRKDVIEVYRSPQGETYLETSVAKDGDLVAPQAFPDTAVAVSEIIPAR